MFFPYLFKIPCFLFFEFLFAFALKIKYKFSCILWWAGMDSNHRTQMRTDLQSAAFSHSATYPYIFFYCCVIDNSYYKLFNNFCQYIFKIFFIFCILGKKNNLAIENIVKLFFYTLMFNS